MDVEFDVMMFEFGMMMHLDETDRNTLSMPCRKLTLAKIYRGIVSDKRLFHH